MSSINLTPLKKAFEQFQTMYYFYQENQEESIVEEVVNESLVHRFEYCEDLFWKLLRKNLLEQKGVDIENAPKTVYRRASQLEILDFEVWVEFLNAKNQSSHTYNEETLEEVLSVMGDFAEHGKNVLKYLEDNLNNE